MQQTDYFIHSAELNEARDPLHSLIPKKQSKLVHATKLNVLDDLLLFQVSDIVLRHSSLWRFAEEPTP